jgi:hypothetical protein
MGLTDQWWRYSSEEILETYKNNLKALGGGFRHVLDLPVKNSTGGVVYILLFATDNDTAVKILREHMRHLEKLNTDQLRVLFLREQGEYVPDLRPFLEGASMVRKPEPDPLQSELIRFMSKGRNGFS